MKDIESLVNLENLIKKNRYLYQYDIFKITKNILKSQTSSREELENCSIYELEHYTKFIETLLFYIDIVLLEEKNIHFILENNHTHPTPCYCRIITVLTLIEEKIMDLPKTFQYEKLIPKNYLNQKLKEKKYEELLKKHPTIIPELFPIYEKMLIELSFRNIYHFSKKHLCNLEKGSLKLFLKIKKIKNIEEKKELMEIAFENLPLEERLKIFQSSITETYEFTDSNYGEYWRKLYKRLQIWKNSQK